MSHPNRSIPSHPSKGEAPSQLVDNHGRTITYLRLSVTDRCDLRCRYCCPEKGIDLVPHEEILSFEEMDRLVRIFASMGVGKVRITGGEPFARKGLLSFLVKLKKNTGLKTLFITTNGVQAGKHLDALAAAGIDGINLSLDTVDRKRFWTITRRDRLDEVLQTFDGALARSIPIKINSVVLADSEDEDIEKLVGLCRRNAVTVRFIEKMPFSGGGPAADFDGAPLYDRLKGIFPDMTEEQSQTPSTARLFHLPGYAGKIGIIEGRSRHFCSTCNKVRVTATGTLKTCLYDNGVLDLRALLRGDCDDAEIVSQIRSSVNSSWEDGHAAEKKALRSSEPSMAGIGG